MRWRRILYGFCVLLVVSACSAALPGMLGDIGDVGAYPSFGPTRTEVVVDEVVLRSDHPLQMCRTPVEFFAVLRDAINQEPSGVPGRTCKAQLLKPNSDDPTSLVYWCPIAKTERCTEHFNATVWPVLEREAYCADPPQRYCPVYSLEGISRAYRKCEPSPDAMNNEQAARHPTYGALQHLDIDLFRRHARMCTLPPVQ